MKVGRKQFVMTKSNDGCVIIVKGSEKTDKNDMFISEEVLKRNVETGTFSKHSTLRFEGEPIYVLTEDLKR